MIRLLPTLMVILFLLSITMLPRGANGGSPPVSRPEPSANKAALLNPNQHSVIASGIPAGETREWEEREIPHSVYGTMTAQCLAQLISQRIFPEAGPSLRTGWFCLTDFAILGPKSHPSRSSAKFPLLLRQT